MRDDDLLPNELVFLANALDGPLLAFEPLDDPMVADLIERQLVVVRAQADPKYSLLDLTEAGRLAVQKQLR